MIWHPLWLERIRQAWSERPVVWLSGVRRVGKTTLAGMLPDAVYFNCDLPSTARAVNAPQWLAPNAVRVPSGMAPSPPEPPPS